MQPTNPLSAIAETRPSYNPEERRDKTPIPEHLLAKLWQKQGKTNEAYDLLKGVYDWFTEGFDSVDLKEAREILNELKGVSKKV